MKSPEITIGAFRFYKVLCVVYLSDTQTKTSSEHIVLLNSIICM